MSGIVDRLRARLPARPTLMVAVVIPVAVESEVLVGGAAIGSAPREQACLQPLQPAIPAEHSPLPPPSVSLGAGACSGSAW